MTSALREAPLPTGKPGPFSARRIGALLLIPSGIAAIILGILRASSWEVIAIAGGIPIAGGVFLLLFTTWADIKALIAAYKGGTVE